MSRGWSWIRSLFARPNPKCPECHSEVSKVEAYCEVCGYDVVRNAKSGGGPRVGY